MVQRLVLVLLFAALAGQAPAYAQNRPLGNHGAWETFAYSEKGGKVCYMASLPQRSQGAAKDRNLAALTVTHRTADKSIGVVSVAGGYAYRKASEVEVDIDGTRFKLYTSGDTAWARDDKPLVEAMIKGRTLTVSGTPAKGAATLDAYSLAGFSAAYAEISKACAVR